MITRLTLIIKTKIIEILKIILNSKKNKLNNKFERHNDDATTRDDDKSDDFYDNSKLFKKLKNEINDKKFNYFICEKSKH